MTLKFYRLIRIAGWWVLGCAVSFAAGMIAGRAVHDTPIELDRTARVKTLVNELVASPERQQRALDEIAKDGDGDYAYLLAHLDDARPLASIHVQYLSTHPNRPERYALIRSHTVGEALLRYLCWSTESCEFNFQRDDQQAMLAQRRKAEAFIAQRWLPPSRL